MKRFGILLVAVAVPVGILFARCAEAQVTVKTLLTFTGGTLTGNTPEGNLAFDSAGNLYGTTSDPETTEVFQLTPNSDGTWTENILWTPLEQSDPTGIRSGVVVDAAGNLYGTSYYGGIEDSNGCCGCGTVFKLTHNSDATWTAKSLVEFDCGSGGMHPVGGVTIDNAGNIFGGTTLGGNFASGVIYELTPNSDGSYTENVIHHFTGGADGAYPDHQSLVLDSSGNLYGAAAQGAHQACPFVFGSGCGTIFKMASHAGGTWTFTVLHAFTGGADGGTPEATLLVDTAGNLYGTTYQGGKYGYGVAFELSPHANGKWGERVLHAFKNGGDGANPIAGLISDTSGNLYGTTNFGGNSQCGANRTPIGCGIVYELTPNSNGSTTETVLVRFHGTPNATPYNDLLMDSLGNLYGISTDYGNDYPFGSGAVYEVLRQPSRN